MLGCSVSYSMLLISRKPLARPYDIVPYPTLPYPTLPYPTLRYDTLPTTPTLPYPTLPYPYSTPFYATLPYPIPALPHLVKPKDVGVLRELQHVADLPEDASPCPQELVVLHRRRRNRQAFPAHKHPASQHTRQGTQSSERRTVAHITINLYINR